MRSANPKAQGSRYKWFTSCILIFVPCTLEVVDFINCNANYFRKVKIKIFQTKGIKLNKTGQLN